MKQESNELKRDNEYRRDNYHLIIIANTVEESASSAALLLLIILGPALTASDLEASIIIFVILYIDSLDVDHASGIRF